MIIVGRSHFPVVSTLRLPYTYSKMVHTRETRGAASEIKFLIAAATAPRIAEWARTHLGADPHGGGPFGDEYNTSSLYFDTTRLDVFHRRGSYGRAKYRVRRYNHADAVFLERKLRKPGILIKRRTAAPAGELQLLQAPAVHDDWAGDWFRRRVALRKLQPVCQVSYHRMARVIMSDAGLARLTMDSALQASPVHAAQFGTAQGVEILQEGVILELKYLLYLPALFRQLVEEFALQPASCSKYRLAMVALGKASDRASDDASAAPTVARA